MHERRTDTTRPGMRIDIDIDIVPELPTTVGMPGASLRAEVGGQSCSDTGILVAMIGFAGA